LDGVFERASAVVEPWENVAVNIDHFPVPDGKIPEAMAADNR